MKKSTWAEDIILELKLQLRNRWTITIGLILILIAIVAVLIPRNAVKSDALLLEGVRTYMQSEAELEAWLFSPDAGQIFVNHIYAANPQNAANAVLTILGALGPLLFAVWGASVTGNEFMRRTVRTRAAHNGWKRSVLIKIVTIGIMAILGVLAAIGIGIAVSNISWLSLKNAYPWMHISYKGEVVNKLLSPILVIIGISFYGILASFAALLFKSLPTGIFVGLAVPYVEKFLSNWWLPQAAFANLLTRNLYYYEGSFAYAPASGSLPPVHWTSWVVLLLWIGMVVLVSYCVSNRQEIA